MMIWYDDDYNSDDNVGDDVNDDSDEVDGEKHCGDTMIM